jgi:hypothetical protein
MNTAMEGFNRNANRVINSLIPVGSNIKPVESTSWLYTTVIIVVFVAAFVGLLYYFKDYLSELFNTATDIVNGYFTGQPSSAPAPVPTPAETNDASGNPSPSPGEGVPPAAANAQKGQGSDLSIQNMEKILPGGLGSKEVFNVSSNKYTYYDAEPLCKALGAELATYDQVKEAWSKGADWCNYGWIKGQMAVYPTSDDTFTKLQGGPAEQHLACGKPGVNGGFFDNPELRYGVTCYGSKPSKANHDESAAAMATPTSPDALEFDKKVAEFKAEADTIGIMPFNANKL